MSRDTIRLPHDAYRLLQTLRAAGHSAYVVGGCVRDSLLGRLPGDWDICTSARPDEMKALFCSQRLILTGEKHGTVAVILHGKPYEMTTYRLDGSYRDHRHPDNVQFVDDLAADLARRDFTINAMAYAPGEGVIDLYGGRSDLAARVVRCVGTPADRFAEDALRILRALRFSAKLGFALDPATAAAALAARDTLRTVSAERLYTELDGLLLAASGIGLGSCWINRAKETFETPEGQALLAKWGLDPEKYIGVGYCILGYPAPNGTRTPGPRKAGYVLHV